MNISITNTKIEKNPLILLEIRIKKLLKQSKSQRAVKK